MAQQRSFDLPAAAAVLTIPEFARQAGVQIIAPAESLDGVTTPTVTGTLDVLAALALLLKDTRLDVASYDGTIITLRNRPVLRQARPAPPPAPVRPPPPPPAPPRKVTPLPQLALDEIIITGTRISREGFQTPTPVTVIGQDVIEAVAPENLADYVNELPLVVGSISPKTNGVGVSNGLAGINALNLRGLGTQRTLVLLDNQRSVGASLTQVVDVSDFPQELVSRIDVVTGGASAAYGSDAVSGVVNFILDKRFVGLKGRVEGGVTTYGDDASWKVSLTGGTAFGGDRGHFLFSGELSNRGGILNAPRDWNQQGWMIMNNPTYTAANGQPERLLLNHVSLGNATLGGIITNTPLKGIAFGPGGQPYQFNYGSLVFDPWQQGGDWQSALVNDISLDPSQKRESAFLRASYHITDATEVFAQLSWGNSRTYLNSALQFNLGNIVLKPDNAFLPAGIGARMTALGITQFTLGSNNGDLPRVNANNGRIVNRYVVGANGATDLFGGPWTWDAYFQRGVTHTSEHVGNVTSKARYASALDAVRAPNGAIVCRSTLSDPSNGCVPYNAMGQGVNGPAVVTYLEGEAVRNQVLTQDAVSIILRGEPAASWAGPVSFATGLEWRRESVRGATDAISQTNGWFAGNFLPSFGSFSVAEGFVEAVVPLAKDVSWAYALDVNAAARFTGYSISGFVTTWKLGATYQPIADLRLRLSHSRDIRAPNLQELFNVGGSNTSSVTDPFNGNVSVNYQGFAVGNLNLMPEKADTTGLGIVAQPSFFPGLSVSFDYFHIAIDNAIGSVTAQAIVDRCFGGDPVFCGAILRGAGAGGGNVITQIRISPFNLVRQTNRGFDIEAAYDVDLKKIATGWDGAVTFRLLATRYLEAYSDNGLDPPSDTVGSNSSFGPPNWIYRATLAYQLAPVTMSVTGRGVSGGTIDNTFIQCTAGCPVSTANNRTININAIPGAFYMDASLSYRLDAASMAEAFINVQNLANRDPPPVIIGPGGNAYTSITANAQLYDTLGRTFRAGVRFKM